MGKNHRGNRTVVHHNKHEMELRKAADKKRAHGTHHPKHHHDAEAGAEADAAVAVAAVEEVAVEAQQEVAVEAAQEALQSPKDARVVVREDDENAADEVPEKCAEVDAAEEALRTRIAKLEQAAQESAREAEGLRAQLEERAAELAMTQQELGAAHGELQGKNGELAAARKEVEDKDAELAGKDAQLVVRAAVIEALTKQLAEKDRQLAALTASAEAPKESASCSTQTDDEAPKESASCSTQTDDEDVQAPAATQHQKPEEAAAACEAAPAAETPAVPVVRVTLTEEKAKRSSPGGYPLCPRDPWAAPMIRRVVGWRVVESHHANPHVAANKAARNTLSLKPWRP